MIKDETFYILRKFWCLINTGNKKDISIVIMLMICNSLFEMASIGAIIPFISILISPNLILNNDLFEKIKLIMPFLNNENILLFISSTFIIIVILSTVIKYSLLKFSTSLSVKIGCDISEDIYKRTLFQDYIVHISRNSTNIIDGIINKTGSAIIVIEACLSVIASSIILITILFTLLYINILLTIITFSGIGAIYYSLIKYNHKKIIDNGGIASRLSKTVLRNLQEGLGGIREILIDGTQQLYCDAYKISVIKMREAEGHNRIIGSSPKFLIEGIAMIFIIGLAYFSSFSLELTTSILPILAALVLGAQRLLPVLQQLYVSWAVINGNRSALIDVIELLQQPLDSIYYPSAPEITFSKKFELNNISYKYGNNSPFLFQNLSLSIQKGSCIGFIGKSGCGKSTLLDIIMGLLAPSDGNILVDGTILNRQNIQQWRSKISHVPQTIYLTDASVAENIAFGIPVHEINMDRVKEVSGYAQISRDIESWPKGYFTNVGERGVQLSGGQRQRIGIARALYKRSKILVFDEATSALDVETEGVITDTLKSIGLGLTILIVAHRHSTLKNCDVVYQLDEVGVLQVAKMGNFNEYKYIF
jgi:ABC-type multidrug transport system fused ATPase/permease subunit